MNIDDLIGMPYVYGGRGYKGYDCIGLVIEVERRLGHEIPDAEYYRNRDALKQFQTLVEERANQMDQVKLVESPEKEGDVLLFKNKLGLLHHIGVYVGNDKFIHCNKYGVHIERLSLFSEKIGRVYTWQQ